MSTSVATVLAAAEALSDAERRELIHLLTVGLDDPAPAIEPETPPLSEAWLREINRRSEEYDAGRVATRSWEEVQERLNARRVADG